MVSEINFETIPKTSRSFTSLSFCSSSLPVGVAIDAVVTAGVVIAEANSSTKTSRSFKAVLSVISP